VNNLLLTNKKSIKVNRELKSSHMRMDTTKSTILKEGTCRKPWFPRVWDFPEGGERIMNETY